MNNRRAFSSCSWPDQLGSFSRSKSALKAMHLEYKIFNSNILYIRLKWPDAGGDTPSIPIQCGIAHRIIAFSDST